MKPIPGVAEEPGLDGAHDHLLGNPMRSDRDYRP
jgi:hypothetical protein